MKKVAFIINDMRIGGAERVLANLTLGLPADWEIDIILTDASEIEYPFRGNVIDLKIIRGGNNFVYYFKVLMKRIRVLRKLKKEKKYDACIGFADSASVANILSGRKYCRIITAVHSTLSEASRLKSYKYIVSPFARLLYNKSDCVVAVAEGVRQDLIHNYGIDAKKITTIYNGCDIKEIAEKKEDPLEADMETILNQHYNIVTMGRMDIPKAQWHLIRAFRLVADEIPETQLVILGNGEQAEYLRKLADEMRLSERIVFAGFYSNPFRVLSKCQMFVFSSIYEGFPNAMIEAMCCGLPVIATDFNTGARELLAPASDVRRKVTNEMEIAEYGILTPVCDGVQYSAGDQLTEEEDILAKAMIRMLRDDKLQETYRQKAVERAKCFDTGCMIKQWKELIETLVNR